MGVVIAVYSINLGVWLMGVAMFSEALLEKLEPMAFVLYAYILIMLHIQICNLYL